MKIIHKTRLLAVNETQILVIEKQSRKTQLTLAGGTRKNDDTFEYSLAQQAKKEIDLDVNPNKLVYVSSSAKRKNNTIIIKNYFTVSTQTTAFTVLDPTKFKTAFWIYWKDALQFLDKEDKTTITRYFKAINHNI